jgi:cytochrome c peroxidase
VQRVLGLLAALLAAGQAMAAPPAPPLSARAELGRTLFFDPRLSASGRLACAGCHDPAHAYAPANRLAVQPGGPEQKTPGTRAVPSLRYKYYTRAYSDRYENPDHLSPPAPGGGFTWDGRADTLAQQAEIPLLAANEMANPDRAALAGKLKALYEQPLRAAFGEPALADPVAYAGKALQAFQQEDRSFRPFSSRFDKYRGNKLGGTLSAQELRGLVLYMSPAKGNCNACHLLGAGNNGSQDISTDYGYAAIGVPRNPEIPANADPAYYDLGLCGPLRKDHAPAAPGAADPYCGQFKTPVLRNVSTRGVFMHNGYFKSLREVLHFYATRDTQPQRWYPKDAQGKVRKFDDLPEAYRGNIDRQMPLDLRAAGSQPALSEAEIDDLLAFLKTLDDEGVSEIPQAQ